ncbi:MAG: PEP-CTERM sorting domain-containing protein [Acidobacteriales bacterium]|nr:PEP-CTERM sorting domain-containing protein [Terriglobales bacterium]
MSKKLAILTLILLASLTAGYGDSWSLSGTLTNNAQFTLTLVGPTATPNQYEYTLTVNTATYTGPGNYLWAIAIKTSDKIDGITGTGPSGGDPWNFQLGNASANGCGGQDNGFGCVEATAVPNNGLGVGANGGTFSFTFLITLQPGGVLLDPPHLQARFGDNVCTTTKATKKAASTTTCEFNNMFGISSDLVKDRPPVPEPASMALLGTGLIGAGRFVRRRIKK